MSSIVKLTDEQLSQKIKFIKKYMDAVNAADGSDVDANANVSHKNIATLEAEINKDINIQINQRLIYDKICEIYGNDLADEFIRQIESHEIYLHDASALRPYCVSISMYPFLLDGMVSLGGESKAPLHMESFCGSFINLVFAISSQFAGAIATVEFLMMFDHFAKKDYGKNYLKTHRSEVANHLQHVVYALNQPAAARGYQSVFWNITVFDRSYFNSIFENFYFPDGGVPDYDSVSKLQDFFMDWFNRERTKAVLSFPVVTAAMLKEEESKKIVDLNFAQMCAKEMSRGNSFFIYMSDSPDSLASCCRLRNEFSDNTFSYTLGAGGVSTGSINVMTLNMNRFIQNCYRKFELIEETDDLELFIESELYFQINKMQKYQIAYRKIVEEYLEARLLTVYDAGFISLDKQFLTLGINGMVEAAEFCGIPAKNTPEYKAFVSSKLKVIFDANKAMTEKVGYKFNTEFVPAENLGVKFAKWDKEDGYFVPRNCYNSYFYAVEDEDINVLDKLILHGEDIVKFLDGGSACHLNLEEHLTEDGFMRLFEAAAITGTNYFTYNVPSTCCNKCGYIDKRRIYSCSKCGTDDVDYATRIIGYLKKVSSYSSDRRDEESNRNYHDTTEEPTLVKTTSNPVCCKDGVCSFG